MRLHRARRKRAPIGAGGAAARRAGTVRTLALVAAFLSGAAAHAQTPGFNLCVEPRKPACVFDKASPPGRCEPEIDAYVATVFRFRECLARESERVVRDSNDVIDHWRCRQRGERCH
jgi:hypothetical protein